MATGDNPAMVHYLSNMAAAPQNSLCIMICSKPAKVQKSGIYNSHTEFINITVVTWTVRRPTKLVGEALIEMKSLFYQYFFE